MYEKNTIIKRLEKLTGLKDKNDIICLVVTVFTLILSGPILWFFLSKKSGVGYIEEKYLSAWIGYYGSIIGGVITFFGVWWTISVNDKNRKEDIKDNYLPIPAIYSVSSQENKSYFDVLKNEIQFNSIKCDLKNIGKGPMLQIKFDEEEPFFLIFNELKYIPTQFGFYLPYALDSSEIYNIFFPPIKISLDTSSVPENGHYFYYFTHIGYSDAFHRHYDVYIKIIFNYNSDTCGLEKCVEISKDEYEQKKQLENVILD